MNEFNLRLKRQKINGLGDLCNKVPAALTFLDDAFQFRPFLGA
jgi:hypothetical protein